MKAWNPELMRVQFMWSLSFPEQGFQFMFSLDAVVNTDHVEKAKLTVLSFCLISSFWRL
jgi:hypothetical protein